MCSPRAASMLRAIGTVKRLSCDDYDVGERRYLPPLALWEKLIPIHLTRYVVVLVVDYGTSYFL